MSGEACVEPPGGGPLSAEASDDQITLQVDTELIAYLSSVQNPQCETKCISRDTEASKSESVVSNGGLNMVSDVKDDASVNVHNEQRNSSNDDTSRRQSNSCETDDCINGQSESVEVSNSEQEARRPAKLKNTSEDRDFGDADINDTEVQTVDEDVNVTVSVANKVTRTGVTSVISSRENETEKSVYVPNNIYDAIRKEDTPKDFLDKKRENILSQADGTKSVNSSEVCHSNPKKGICTTEVETNSENTGHETQLSGQMETELKQDDQAVIEDGKDMTKVQHEGYTTTEDNDGQAVSKMQQDDEAVIDKNGHVTETQQHGIKTQHINQTENDMCDIEASEEYDLPDTKTPTRDVDEVELKDDENESDIEGWHIKISDVRTVSFDEEEDESESAMTIIDLNESVGLTSDTSQFESPDGKCISRLGNKEAKSTVQEVSSTVTCSTKQDIDTQSESKDLPGKSTVSEQLSEKPLSQSGQQTDMSLDEESNAANSDHTPASSLLSNIAKTLENMKPEPVDLGYDKATKERADGDQRRISKTLPEVDLPLKNRNNTNTGITPMLPSPRLMPFLPVIATTSKTIQASSSRSSTITQPNAPLLSSAGSSSEVSVSLESDKNVLQSTEKTARSKGSIGNEIQEEKESTFMDNIVNNFHKYSLKSVDLESITQFLQRKNCVKSYQAQGTGEPEFKIRVCLECGDSFILKESIDCHMLRCSMKIIFFCSKCDATLYFVNKCQLLSHVRKHTEIDKNNHLKPLKINSDHISILTPTAKDIHAFVTMEFEHTSDSTDLRHRTFEKVKCIICHREFANETSLKTHFGANDLICSMSYKCSSCTRVMPRQCAFIAHQGIHNSPRESINVCPECGKPFMTDNKTYLKHVNDECFHNRRVFFLLCCGEMFEGLPNTKEHFMKKHVKQYVKCKLCNVAYEKEERFHDHLQEVHSMSPDNNLSYVSTCQLCKSLFKTDEFLQKHVDSHVNEMKKNAQFGFKCIHCDTPKLFSSKRMLTIHEANYHKILHILTCNSCGLSFRTEATLQCHRNNAHCDQPHLVKNNRSIPFQCSKCKQMFTKLQALSSHQCSAGVTGVKTLPSVAVLVCVRCHEVLPNNSFSKHVCSKAKAVAYKPFPVKVVSLESQAVQKKVHKIYGTCNFCLKMFPADDLQKHMESCPSRSKQGQAQTQHCNIKFEPSHQTSPNTPGSVKRKLQSTHMFKCSICTVGFPSRKRLDVHMQAHSSEGALTCNICHAQYFNSMAELQAHVAECKAMDARVYKDEVKCPVCKSYSTKYSLTMVRHLRKHSLTGQLVCRYCHKTEFSQVTELRVHERSCGADSYPLEQGFCFLCQTDMGSLDDLVVHLQKHVVEGSLVCCKCQKTGFETSAKLAQHQDACGKNLLEDVSGGICTLCRKLFQSEREALQKHITEHVKRGALICCCCQKMGWKSFADMKSHTIACGAFAKPVKFRCVICTAKFSGEDMLKRHLKMHISQGFLVCLNCQKINWTDREHLKTHQRNCFENLGASNPEKSKINRMNEPHVSPLDHSSQGTFKTMDHFCEYCGKRFFQLSSLQEHIRQEHTSFPCHLCGLAYESKAELIHHVNMVHDGKRDLLSCDICKAKNINKCFTSQNGLDRHISKMHKHARRRSNSMDSKEQINVENNSLQCSSDRPSPRKRLRIEGDIIYTCAKCSFVTENDGEFAEHIKQHSDDKSTQCPDCGLCFAVLPTLKKHLFIVHKIKDAEKYLQGKGIKTEEEMDSDAEDILPFVKKSAETEDVDVVENEESLPGHELECKVCYKNFESEKQLKTHMRIHGMAFIRAKRRGETHSTPPSAKRPSPSKSDASGESPEAASGDQEKAKKVKSEPSEVAFSTLREESEDDHVSSVQIKQEPMET